jgi:positive regulator of sigma E activity
MNAQLEREGVVVSAVAAGGRVRLRLQPSADCAGCSCRSACSADEAHEQLVSVTLPNDAAPGERVRLQLPESALPLAALLGYLLPVVCLLAGAMFLRQVSDTDGAPVLGALGGLLAGQLLVHRVARLPLAGALQVSACHVPDPSLSTPPLPEDDA